MIASLIARCTAFGFAHWKAIGLGLLIAFAGLQTARLSHAKADQFDRSACVKGQPCHPPKWKAETIALRGQVSGLQRDLKTCKANTTTLEASIARQNDAVKAIQTVSDRKLAASAKAAQDARAVAESARQTSGAIMARHLLGATACERAEEVDEAFVGALK